MALFVWVLANVSDAGSLVGWLFPRGNEGWAMLALLAFSWSAGLLVTYGLVAFMMR